MGRSLKRLDKSSDLPEDTAYGKSIREQAKADRESYPEGMRLANVRGVGDVLTLAKEGVLEQAPQMGAQILAAIGGGLVGGPVGAVAGATAIGAGMNFGEQFASLKEEDPNAEAGVSTYAAGTAISALDALPGGRVIRQVYKAFGKEAAEKVAEATMAKLAERSYFKHVGIETAKTVGLEATTEALQEAIGEFGLAGELDRPPKWGELPMRMAEAGFVGGVAGGFYGGIGHAIAGKPRVEGVPGEPGTEPPPPGPPAGPPTAPPTGGPSEIPQPGAFPGTALPIGQWETPPTGTAYGGGNVVQFLMPGTLATPGGRMASEGAFVLRRMDDGTLRSEQVQPGVTSLPNQWYYSAVRKAAEDILPSGGRAELMFNMLKKGQNVKAEELDALGLAAYFQQNAGKRITKEEVISEIESKAMRVETRRREPPPPPPPVPWETRPSPVGNVYITPTDTRWVIRPPEDPTGRFRVVRRGELITQTNTLDEAKRAVENRMGPRDARTPDKRLYGKYTLPGGENYTETVYSIPRKKKSYAEKLRDNAILKRVDEISTKRMLEQEALTQEEWDLYNEFVDGNKYEALFADEHPVDFIDAGHWPDDPNPLAHSREADRTFTDGKTTKHIDELQSTWMQLGAKYGFLRQGELTSEILLKEIADVQKAIMKVESARQDIVTRPDDPETPEQIKTIRHQYRQMTDDIDLLYQQESALRDLLQEVGRKVADAPGFKTSWGELVLKQILYRAALEGKDRVFVDSRRDSE